MRADESKYWDHVAKEVKGKGTGELYDNIWKRCAILSRILAHRPVHAAILEIGVGQGLTAAVVNLVALGNIKYVGTDVSSAFCEFVDKRWKLPTKHTDILALPDGPFDMIWALDTLEHVNPEDRERGYIEMGRVLADHGMIFLNVPRDESGHQEQYDWGTSEDEIYRIAAATRTKVTKLERYSIEEIGRSYLWVELTR